VTETQTEKGKRTARTSSSCSPPTSSKPGGMTAGEDDNRPKAAATAAAAASPLQIPDRYHSEPHFARVIHVGAGAAGLLAAYKAERMLRNYELVVYEKCGRTGYVVAIVQVLSADAHAEMTLSEGPGSRIGIPDARRSYYLRPLLPSLMRGLHAIQQLRRPLAHLQLLVRAERGVVFLLRPRRGDPGVLCAVL
jgi:hypothetical protein